MKRLLLLLFAVFYLSAGFSQDFFNSDFNPKKKYIILTNPTVGNLKAIQFLISADLLDVNTKKTKFINIYYKKQNYDFNKSKQCIENNHIKFYASQP